MGVLHRAKQSAKVLFNLRRLPRPPPSRSRSMPRSSAKAMSVSISAPTWVGSRCFWLGRRDLRGR